MDMPNLPVRLAARSLCGGKSGRYQASFEIAGCTWTELPVFLCHGAVASKEANTMRPPPDQPETDSCSPSQTYAKSAPNAGSLPISNATRVGLLRFTAKFCAKKANSVHASTR